VAGQEDDQPRFDPLGFRLEADGYDWNQIQIWDFTPRTKKEGNREVETFDDRSSSSRASSRRLLPSDSRTRCAAPIPR
jgi:hypothetical protein